MSAAQAVADFRALVDQREREARRKQEPPPRVSLVKVGEVVYRRPGAAKLSRARS